MKKNRICLAVLMALFVCAECVFAQESVPSAINFQGELYDPSANGGTGGPLAGVQQVEFRIYDSLTGGTLIWGRTFPVFCNHEGVFNVVLNDDGNWIDGTINSLRDAFQDDERFLELTVQGHGSAIAPRQQCVSAPYAMHSEHATHADDALQGFDVENGLVVQSGGANITGDLTCQGSASVSAQLSAASLSVSGDATIAGNLAVSAPSAISGYGTIPIGGIIMWSGTSGNIPDGWALCNGQGVNNLTTPDLRDRFIVGAGGAYTVSTMGGQETVNLTTNNLPPHSHHYTDAYYCEAGGPTHPCPDGGTELVPDNKQISGMSGAFDNDNTTFWVRGNDAENTGNGSAVENRPPFYALCFIMRIK